MIVSKIKAISPNRPITFVGDFNFGINSKEYRKVSQHFHDTHCQSQSARSRWAVTVHGFKGTKISVFSWNGRLILDYIWVSGPIKVRNTQIIHDNLGEDPSIFPSDHWPVMSDLTIYFNK